ncbi:MAG: 4-(cytidine 5'-diphospho)-2-C-methyl-D-erythritol kinase [Euzebyales bacterium]|nr:4-(cytidine 5'-diphospho)-2-C-methyl-D-erythritol kinase [Euzebyales bacterium]
MPLIASCGHQGGPISRQSEGEEPAVVIGGATADGACVRVRVPAKVNLFLALRGLRQDAFHELVSVLQTVTLFDELRVGVYGPPGRGHHPAARRRMRVELRVAEVAGRASEGLPDAADNLAVLAARALGAHTGVFALGGDAGTAGDTGLRTLIELRKGIPVAGGMAGGSADAAGALVALNQLWECQLDRDQLRDLAAGIGSDVPFCVVGGTVLATGRGTALAQVLCRGTFHWVVCTAHQPLETARVYRAWDTHCRPTEVEPDAVLAALRSQDAEALGAALYNDLQEAAFHLRPELAEQRRALLEAGALGAVVSGSGPTLLALAESAEAAATLAERMAGDFRDVRVARSPAGGPDARPCT